MRGLRRTRSRGTTIQREEGLAAAVMRERIKQRESEAAGGETRERSSSRRSRRSQVEA